MFKHAYLLVNSNKYTGIDGVRQDNRGLQYYNRKLHGPLTNCFPYHSALTEQI